MAVLCVQAIVFLKVFLQLYCAKWGCVAACTPQMQLLALAFVFFIDFLMTVNISGKAHCRESMQVPVKAVSSVKGFSLLKDVCCIRAFMFSFFISFIIIIFPFQHLELQYCMICVMPFYFSCFYVWGQAFRRMCLVMCLGFTEFFYSN